MHIAKAKLSAADHFIEGLMFGIMLKYVLLAVFIALNNGN